MVETMYAADGVGLAACQIGVDRAVFVFDCPDDDGRRTVGVVCNPELTLPEGKDRKLDEGDEGCLSYPGAFVECARPDFATVTGTGLDGAPVEFSGDGMLARCLQHETDHTQGTVFGDRLPTKQRKRLQKAMEKAADDYPLGLAGGVDPASGSSTSRPRRCPRWPTRDLDSASHAHRAARSPPTPVSDERIGVWRRRAVQVVETPDDLPWVTGVLVDDETGDVVGRAGFHGAPDADGMVEVGYGVDPATAAAATPGRRCSLMIDRARSDPSVQRLPGHRVARERRFARAWSRSCRSSRSASSGTTRTASRPSSSWTCPRTGSASRGDVAGHGGRGRDVEGVDAGGHRDDRPAVRGLLPARREAVPLRAEHQRQPVHARRRPPRPGRRRRPGSAPPW